METQFYVHLDFPAAAWVLARLSYSPDTPYCVEVTFYLGGGHAPVMWTLGRELLRDGLSGPAGMGDVQIHPTDLPSHTLCLRLDSRHGTAELSLPGQALGDFLQRTAKAVPYGREAETPGFLTNLDRALATMLAEPC
ncbi:SsgA family sporulation/cell division regulator [Streptomyces sp. WI04-05B]|uniref:Transcriptional regulator n=1 Tax=Streptomyces turgidiscabies (strain Car8) TaxID=698760 RepID=L7F2U6_STRT8|nr:MULTISPECIES: SsgA family sporulation/cell division regulator [Streptomyces]ELP65943.1 transcriptional regulator [Streptomyces turgidiscabies Car8]MDX2547527.1 SsgA family sporulation/cell division regulator [Streptomyces sp. WI04-05B]MDX2589920.1 SsgA family sporulation/cell division regulator [Streptomyces sp. WI04-05A]MDX3499793.1 SsgA family sporulation/cell division regulator [Streptomyces turgidiscabies]